METKAVAKFIRISPRKARLVAQTVMGQPVERAMSQLRFTPKKAGGVLLKVVKSAVANAEQNQDLDVDTLYIKKIYVDGGPMMKRWRPRAQGRVYQIRKRTSHITVVLDEA
jgi:large subunit ribosomal protein L22